LESRLPEIVVAAVMVIIISIQPLGRFWQEPEPRQATGMALACCILGNFLGVVCHCFPLVMVIYEDKSNWVIYYLIVCCCAICCLLWCETRYIMLWRL
jgi:hypothetical protein